MDSFVKRYHALIHELEQVRERFSEANRVSEERRERIRDLEEENKKLREAVMSRILVKNDNDYYNV